MTFSHIYFLHTVYLSNVYSFVSNAVEIHLNPVHILHAGSSFAIGNKSFWQQGHKHIRTEVDTEAASYAFLTKEKIFKGSVHPEINISFLPLEVSSYADRSRLSP